MKKQISNRIIAIKLIEFEDVEKIVPHLKNGYIATVSMTDTNIMKAQRAIDFLSGIMYGLNGTIKEISKSVFICIPENSSIEGDFLNSNMDY